MLETFANGPVIRMSTSNAESYCDQPGMVAANCLEHVLTARDTTRFQAPLSSEYTNALPLAGIRCGGLWSVDHL